MPHRIMRKTPPRRRAHSGTTLSRRVLYKGHPCRQCGRAEARPSDHRDAARGHATPKRLLLIEDDRDGALMLKALLETDRHKVTVCNDGRSGLSQARIDPDAIIIDIGLPDCTGYDVARKLREQPAFSKTLLIALTGYGSERDRQRARESGFDHHLTKPVDFSRLRAVLGRGLPVEGQSHDVNLT